MDFFIYSSRIILDALSAAEEYICLHVSHSPLLTLHSRVYQLAIASIKQPHADDMNFVVQLVS